MVNIPDSLVEEGTHHADKESGLLSRASYTSVTNNTDSESSSETSKSDGEAGSKLCESLGEGHMCFDCRNDRVK